MDIDNALVALSDHLVRGVSTSTVTDGISRVLLSITDANKLSTVQDLFVLLFQTRDIRGGKGERAAAMAMWSVLLSNPVTSSLALDLLDLVPIYGCWQDLFKMPLVAWSRVLVIIKEQFERDELGACDGSGSVSLLAKWMPREGQPMATYCAAQLVPGSMFQGSRMKVYRKRVSRLNKVIDTVEIKMCAGSWAAIDPAKVPSRALKNYTKALLNESGNMSVSGLRCPKSEDRMKCRYTFQEHFAKATDRTDAPFPHEIIPLKALRIQLDSSRYDYVRERIINIYS